VHLAAVVELHALRELLLDAREPLALLRPPAVAARGIGRLEAGDADQVAVVGHADRAAEPALGVGGEPLHPVLGGLPHLLRVADLPLEHLYEHEAAPSTRGQSRVLLPAGARTAHPVYGTGPADTTRTVTGGETTDALSDPSEVAAPELRDPGSYAPTQPPSHVLRPGPPPGKTGRVPPPPSVPAR
jgi:hypothetical protein